MSASRRSRSGSSPDVLSKQDLHIHVPAGAIPKDGPSAGVTMATAIVSAARGIPVRPDVAMTGEITLSGLVLPVGGIREKALAARRQGIKTFVLPEGNMQDLIELPEEVRRDMTFVPARTLEDVLRVALPRGGGHHGGRRSALAQRQRGRGCREDELIRGRVLHLRPWLRPRLPADRNHQRARASAGRTSTCCAYHRAALAPRTHADTSPFRLVDGPCDTGIVQIDSLQLDARATIDAAAAFYATLDERAAERGGAPAPITTSRSSSPTRRRWRARRPRRRASHPSSSRTSPGTGSTRNTVRSCRRRRGLVPLIQQAYAQADAAWRLPMHGGFEIVHDHHRRPVRRAARAPPARRHARRFGLPLDRPRGARVVWRLRRDRPRPAVARLPAPLDHPLDREAASGRPAAGIHVIDDSGSTSAAFATKISSAPSDVVMTKPGYGIVSECLANGTALLYTARGRFAEYPVLVRRDAAVSALRRDLARRSVRRPVACGARRGPPARPRRP